SGSPVFSGLNRKIDDLAAAVQKYVPGSTSNVQAGGSDIPPGLGFDPSSASPTAAIGSAAVPGAGPSGAAGIVWWEPLGSKTVVGADGQQKVIKATYTAAGGPPQAAPVQTVTGAEESIALTPAPADESASGPK